VYCKRFNKTENGVFCEFTSLRDVCNHLPEEYSISPPECWAHPEYVPVCSTEVRKDEYNLFTISSPNYCVTTAVKIAILEKDDEYEPNFCHTKPSKLTYGVLALSLIADALATYYSAGLLTETTIGFTSGIAYVWAEKSEKWP